MDSQLNNKAPNYQFKEQPGKIELKLKNDSKSDRDLSFACLPNVAESCLKINENPDDVYKYTIKGNLVGIISSGTSVLEFGNLGALAAKPVMEGKAMLFKKYGDINAFDIELNTSDIDVFVRTVITMSPTFGAISLEDIKAPECFEIESRLIDALEIPVMHNNQHGTAIVSAAGLINACEIAGKKLHEIKLVINGAGAAAMACANIYLALGVKKENLVMLDSLGVISQKRIDLDKYKQAFAVNTNLDTLEQVLVGADAFIGLSRGNIMTPKMVQTMAENPIVFALANPNPEIAYNDAIKAKYGIIYASGLNDIPNQIDNTLGFPFIFRAALDVRASKINMEMKKAAVYGIAALAKDPGRGTKDYKVLNFGRDYFIPKTSHPKLLETLVPTIANAAIESGVARIVINDWDKYTQELVKRISN